MTATPEGNKKSAETKLTNDPEYFKKIGALGNKAWEANGRKPRGFAVNRELASRAGKVGGKNSKRKAKEL